MQISAPGWDYLWFQWPDLGFYGGLVCHWNRLIAGTRSRWISRLLSLADLMPFDRKHTQPSSLTHSVFCGWQTLSSDTEEVDIPYMCYTHSHAPRQSDPFSFMARDTSQLTRNEGCKYVLWRTVFLREKSAAVTKTTREEWSNLQNMSFVEKAVFCLLIASM